MQRHPKLHAMSSKTSSKRSSVIQNVPRRHPKRHPSSKTSSKSSSETSSVIQNVIQLHPKRHATSSKTSTNVIRHPKRHPASSYRQPKRHPSTVINIIADFLIFNSFAIQRLKSNHLKMSYKCDGCSKSYVTRQPRWRRRQSCQGQRTNDGDTHDVTVWAAKRKSSTTINGSGKSKNPKIEALVNGIINGGGAETRSSASTHESGEDITEESEDFTGGNELRCHEQKKR